MLVLGINRNYALQKLYDLNCPLSVYETCQTKQLIDCAKLYECQSLIDLMDEKFEDLQKKDLKEAEEEKVKNGFLEGQLFIYGCYRDNFCVKENAN
ncbi:hypothetical protein CRE_26061 [Caenorhabditis remanei]|uniref:Uncharacterized protein n=1 Tax=Caenorhabditis remanei TaxID=31234 RepID=E3LRH3_CAERE|nr:hypothetical protein CRE_26061 [Caenorhabditis remanei]